MIPDEFAHWREWIDRLQTVALFEPQEFRAAANALSDETFEALSRFYADAVEKRDVDRINAWLDTLQERSPMTADEKGLRNLLILFSYIARCWGRRPFSDQTLTEPLLRPAVPDWSILPADFASLVRPAEIAARFDYVFAGEGIDHVRATVEPDQLAELTRAADDVRQIGFKTIKQWWVRVGTREHIEASMIFNLMGVLDALQLPYYD